MNRSIKFTKDGKDHVYVPNSPLPGDPLMLKVMIANHLNAPQIERRGAVTDEELVDSRLAAIGVSNFEVV